MITVWQRATLPYDHVTDSRHREQSQLLASLTLAAVGVGLLFSPLIVLLNPGVRWAQVQMLVGIIDTLLAFAAYRMARLGNYQLASRLIALFGSFMIAFSAFISGGDAGLRLLYNLNIIILFTGVFLSGRFMLVIVLLQNLAMLLYGGVETNITLQQVVNGPLLFNLTFAITSLLIVGHHNRQDRQYQARLAESEMRYRTAADLAADYAYSFRVEPDGAFTPEWLTDSFYELTGYSPTDLDPQDILQPYHPDDRAGIRAHQRAVVAGEARCDEYRLMVKDGSQRWIEMACRPIWNEAGTRVEHIFGIAQDITERKQAEEQRLEMALAQVRSDLLYGFFRQVAHDFRTSLTVIETSRYMVQQNLQRGETKSVGGHLDSIAHQVNRLNRQIENLRVVSLLNNPTTEPCDLNEISRAEIECHREALAAKSLNFVFTGDFSVPDVHAHPKELRRAIGLLLENAVKYTGTGGTVALKIAHEGELALLEVSDTGIGVGADDRERIFDFFYRAENAVACDPDGYGLGLSVARMIIQAYGGHILVDSEPGAGSTFKMMIPTL